MSVMIEIPDDLVTAMRIPEPEIQKEVKKEIALALYRRWALPLGKARKMAGMTKREFLEELATAGIERHYAAQDLAEDMQYAKGGQ